VKNKKCSASVQANQLQQYRLPIKTYPKRVCLKEKDHTMEEQKAQSQNSIATHVYMTIQGVVLRGTEVVKSLQMKGEILRKKKRRKYPKSCAEKEEQPTFQRGKR